MRPDLQAVWKTPDIHIKRGKCPSFNCWQLLHVLKSAENETKMDLWAVSGGLSPATAIVDIRI
jgi:hypothetical protein